MDKVYRFSFNKDGEGQTSQLIAEDKSEAYMKLEEMRIDAYEVKVDISSTLSLRKDIPLRELARFYETMGKRIAAGAQISTGLEAAIDFSKDIRLKTSISTLKNATDEGFGFGESMERAGFPMRHAKAISSVEQAGATDATFLSLAEECRREEKMASDLSKLLRMPKVFGTLVMMMFYGAFGFLSPMILEKLADIVGEDKLSPFVYSYYQFVKLFSNNIYISTPIYFGIFIGLLFLFKSKAFKALFDKIRVFHEISERGDMASLWLRFGLMYESGMNSQNAAILVSESAKRDDSRMSFISLENHLAAGYGMAKSVETAGFPSYVTRAIKSGEIAGDEGEAMMELSKELFEDVDMLVSQITDTAQTMVTIGMAIVVCIFFMLTYYPLLSTIMSQV